MRSLLLLAGLVCLAGPVLAQAPGKFPPDSLINVKVIPKNTPVMQVVGMMRNFTGALGVRCPFFYVGQEGQPLTTFDFAAEGATLVAEGRLEPAGVYTFKRWRFGGTRR